MKNNKLLLSSFLLCTSLLLAVLLVHNLKSKEENKEEPFRIVPEEIKDQLKAELLLELEDTINARVKEQVELQVASLKTSTQEQIKDALTKNYVDIDWSRESKKDAMRRVVQEIATYDTRGRALSDKELDETTASSMDLKTELPLGFQKSRSEFQLAQATNTEHAHSAEKNKEPEKIGEENTDSIEKALRQKGGILLPKGRTTIETAFNYAQTSSNAINIQGFVILDVLTIGQLSTDTIKRNIFISSISAKHGLWHNFQVEASVPYRFEHDRQNNQSLSEEVTTFNGLGDITVGVSRQIFWEKGWLPDTVASVSFKTTTGQEPYNNDIGIGTGHYSWRGGLVFVKSSDPAVVFGNLSYTYNAEKRDILNFGNINPGNSISASIGTAIALSYQTAINFSYSHSVTFKQSQNNINIPGSFINTATLSTGFTWAFNNSTSLDFGVGVGLTSDTPDVSVSMRVPYSF